MDGLPPTSESELARVIRLRFSAAPRYLTPQPEPRIETVFAVAPGHPNVLSVKGAVCEGFRVKHFRHKVTTLQPPDAAFAQSAPALGWLDPRARIVRNGDVTDQSRMWAREEEVARFAICDWRGIDQTVTFCLEAAQPFTATLRLFLRVPDGFGGSDYTIRCGGRIWTGTVRGNSGVAAKLQNSPDWWQGWRDLPFIWEDAATIEIPAGRSRLQLQPTDIRYGVFFMDLAGCELVPTRVE
jgi:hypothetical protein